MATVLRVLNSRSSDEDSDDKSGSGSDDDDSEETKPEVSDIFFIGFFS